MAWADKPGFCEICGRPIILKSSRHRRCKECAAEMKRLSRIRKRDEIARRERERRAGTDPDWWKGKEHECKVKETCVYGTRDCCMWGQINGKSRLLAGYPIKGGRCDAYRKGKHLRKKKWSDFPDPPVLSPGKLGEV